MYHSSANTMYLSSKSMGFPGALEVAFSLSYFTTSLNRAAGERRSPFQCNWANQQSDREIVLDAGSLAEEEEEEWSPRSKDSC
jgi:hypothetical protein